jgi:hypothetical protein
MQWKYVLQERFLTAVGFVLRLGLFGGVGVERVPKKVMCPLKYANKQNKNLLTYLLHGAEYFLRS